jgi:UDP-glucose 4-epimerase
MDPLALKFIVTCLVFVSLGRLFTFHPIAGSLVAGELLDKAMLVRTFAQHDIVAVMHFAASSLVGEPVAEPQKYYWNNIVGKLSLLDGMREAGCNRLVFSSSGAVYGNAASKALPENYPCAPTSPYGASKWMIERNLKRRHN